MVHVVSWRLREARGEKLDARCKIPFCRCEESRLHRDDKAIPLPILNYERLLRFARNDRKEARNDRKGAHHYRLATADCCLMPVA